MEDSQDIQTHLRGSQPFSVPDSKTKLTLRNKPMSIGDVTIYIREAVADAHTIITPQDTKLVETVQRVREKLAQQEATLELIADTIHNLFPPHKDATRNVRAYRERAEAKNLGAYFVHEDGSYDAACIHKALLAQAVASSYGIKSEFVDFGFSGQVVSGRSDGVSGMHAVLRGEDGRIVDPHKGIYEEKDQYFKRFENISVFEQGREVYTPDAEA